MSYDLKPTQNAALMLADGTVFFGRGIGAKGFSGGEICFTTAPTGYQETLTDPSFSSQIITFTFPHIGNIGTNNADYESAKVFASGVVTGAEISSSSNYRSEKEFNAWLVTNNVVGISEVDTRALTRHIRLNGAQNAVVAHADSKEQINLDDMLARIKKVPDMVGLELAKKVTTDVSYRFDDAEFNFETNKYNAPDSRQFKVVAIDFGVKRNILRSLTSRGCDVTVVPADTSAEKILALSPDGVFLSNGPGDPSKTAEYAASTINKIIATNTPVFGICLGHQILAIALGCETSKLHQGHRGANHPVKNLQTNKVEITSQNHGFAVMQKNIPNGVCQTHISLFDGTNEGIELTGKDVFSVQHHPEASPGPKDSSYLFDKFINIMHSRKSKAA